MVKIKEMQKVDILIVKVVAKLTILSFLEDKEVGNCLWQSG